MHKSFFNTLNDIKKQKKKQSRKPGESREEKQPVSPEENEDMSSSEEKRLKQLGVFKKKIHKQPKDAPSMRQWRHDKCSSDILKPVITAKPPSDDGPMTLYFPQEPGYSQIFKPIRDLKIFVREIDGSKVSFNSKQSFQEAKLKYDKANISYRTEP